VDAGAADAGALDAQQADAAGADAEVADDAGGADADVNDAGADAGAPDAAPTDAEPAGAWRPVHQEPSVSTETLQNLTGAANARGDSALAWERYPGVLQAVVFDAAAGTWGPVSTFALADHYNVTPALAVLPDGEVLLAYVEAAVSGARVRLRLLRARAGAWSAPEDVAELDVDYNRGVVLGELVADARGHAAIAWLGTRRGTSTLEAHVALLTAAGWRAERLGDLGAPVQLALDAQDNLHALYVGYVGVGAPTLDVLARRFSFVDDTWDAPRAVLQSAASYSCGRSAPCYALAVEPGGAPVALTWDAVGTFGGQGTVTPHRFDAAGGTWSAGAPLARDTEPPRLRSGAPGVVVALYGTVGPQQGPQLEVRRLDSVSGTWAAPERLEPFTLEDAWVNGRGAVMVRGNVNTVPATTLSAGSGLSAPALIEDFDACGPRATAIAVGDTGAQVGQICRAPGGAFPMFVRARWVPIP
jgi:hypothetical protein